MNACALPVADLSLRDWCARPDTRLQTEAVNDESSQDAELLRLVAQGDRQAFSALYDRYATVLFSCAVKILNNPRDAEDVMQEVFLQIWDKAASYDPALGKPFNWALTLTRNRAIDRLRALQRRFKLVEAVTQEEAGNEPAPRAGAEEVYAGETVKLVRTVVQTLPPEQRQAIELAYFGGLTHVEISESLQQPLGTIKARVRRGLLKLRDALEGKL